MVPVRKTQNLRALMTAGLLFGTLVLTGAEELSVVYLEGWVDIRTGGSWRELSIGDTLESSATVRLDEDSLLELSGRSAELTLSEPGTYSLSKLLRSISARERAGYGPVLTSKLKSVFSGRKEEHEQSAVGGVRGDAVGNSEFGWVEDDTTELITAGAEALNREEYDLARELFLEAYDYAYDPETEREILFYLALAEDLRGARGAALTYLKRAEFAPGEDLYDEYVLLKAKLLIDGFEYTEAVDLLKNYLETLDGNASEKAQTACFLLGIVYDALGDPRSEEYLTRAVEIDPDSEVGGAAASFLP